MDALERKRNYPPPGQYETVDVRAPRKGKIRSGMSKAENATYLDEEMRSCLDCPPVGVYNPRQAQEENHAPRWKLAVPKKEKK